MVLEDDELAEFDEANASVDMNTVDAGEVLTLAFDQFKMDQEAEDNK